MNQNLLQIILTQTNVKWRLKNIVVAHQFIARVAALLAQCE